MNPLPFMPMPFCYAFKLNALELNKLTILNYIADEMYKI